MSEEGVTCTVEVSEEEAAIIISALLELAARYTHMLEVCEFGDHDAYADAYREKIEKVHELIAVFRGEDDEIDFEVDPESGEVKP